MDAGDDEMNVDRSWFLMLLGEMITPRRVAATKKAKVLGLCITKNVQVNELIYETFQYWNLYLNEVIKSKGALICALHIIIVTG